MLFRLEVLPLREGGESLSSVLLARGITSEEDRNDLWWVELEWCVCGLESVVMEMLAGGWYSAGRLCDEVDCRNHSNTMINNHTYSVGGG